MGEIKIASRSPLIFDIHEARSFHGYSFELDENDGRLEGRTKMYRDIMTGVMAAFLGVAPCVYGQTVVTCTYKDNPELNVTAKKTENGLFYDLQFNGHGFDMAVVKTNDKECPRRVLLAGDVPIGHDAVRFHTQPIDEKCITPIPRDSEEFQSYARTFDKGTLVAQVK